MTSRLSASSSESASETESDHGHGLGKDGESENAASTFDSHIRSGENESDEEEIDYDAMFPNRYDPKEDKYMIECVKKATETMKPPIVAPWHPPRGGGGRGGKRFGDHRGRGRAGFKRGRFQR